MDPKWLIVKLVGREECNDSWNAMIIHIGVVAHCLQSLLGAIEVIILCTFVCKVGYFDTYIKETLHV